MATPAPTTPSSPPTLPTSNDPESTFDTLWDGFNTWLTATLWPYLAAVVAGTAANATEAETAANTATAQAVAAHAAASAAAGAANFKGEWASLSGALARPACVKHNGRFWLLLTDLTNVATATPGVSAAWTVMDAGTVPSQLVTTAGATVAATVGVRYVLDANNITLTAPTGAAKGDLFGWRLMDGRTGCTVDFGAQKLRGATPGAMVLDIPRLGLDLVFEDTTRGYV